MHLELKKAIIDYMFEHNKDFQLVNKTTEKFRQHIYTNDGNFCIGGAEVSAFILNVDMYILRH